MKVIFINIAPKFLTTSRFFLTIILGSIVFKYMIINCLKSLSLLSKHKVKKQPKNK